MNIFIATPMSAFSEVEYKELQIAIENIKQNRAHNYFSEITQVKTLNNFISPEDAAKKDIQAINVSDKFILIYPKEVLTSIFFELGIAYNLGLSIDIYVKKGVNLPYLTQEINKFNNNITIIEYNEISDLKHEIEESLK